MKYCNCLSREVKFELQHSPFSRIFWSDTHTLPLQSYSRSRHPPRLQIPTTLQTQCMIEAGSRLVASPLNISCLIEKLLINTGLDTIRLEVHPVEGTFLPRLDVLLEGDFARSLTPASHSSLHGVLSAALQHSRSQGSRRISAWHGLTS